MEFDRNSKDESILLMKEYAYVSENYRNSSFAATFHGVLKCKSIDAQPVFIVERATNISVSNYK